MSLSPPPSTSTNYEGHAQDNQKGEEGKAHSQSQSAREGEQQRGKKNKRKIKIMNLHELYCTVRNVLLYKKRGGALLLNFKGKESSDKIINSLFTQEGMKDPNDVGVLKEILGFSWKKRDVLTEEEGEVVFNQLLLVQSLVDGGGPWPPPQFPHPPAFAGVKELLCCLEEGEVVEELEEGELLESEEGEQDAYYSSSSTAEEDVTFLCEYSGAPPKHDDLQIDENRNRNDKPKRRLLGVEEIVQLLDIEDEEHFGDIEDFGASPLAAIDLVDLCDQSATLEEYLGPQPQPNRQKGNEVEKMEDGGNGNEEDSDGSFHSALQSPVQEVPIIGPCTTATPTAAAIAQPPPQPYLTMTKEEEEERSLCKRMGILQCFVKLVNCLGDTNHEPDAIILPTVNHSNQSEKSKNATEIVPMQCGAEEGDLFYSASGESSSPTRSSTPTTTLIKHKTRIKARKPTEEEIALAQSASVSPKRLILQRLSADAANYIKKEPITQEPEPVKTLEMDPLLGPVPSFTEDVAGEEFDILGNLGEEHERKVILGDPELEDQCSNESTKTMINPISQKTTSTSPPLPETPPTISTSFDPLISRDIVQESLFLCDPRVTPRKMENMTKIDNTAAAPPPSKEAHPKKRVRALISSSSSSDSDDYVPLEKSRKTETETVAALDSFKSPQPTRTSPRKRKRADIFTIESTEMSVDKVSSSSSSSGSDDDDEDGVDLDAITRQTPEVKNMLRRLRGELVKSDPRRLVLLQLMNDTRAYRQRFLQQDNYDIHHGLKMFPFFKDYTFVKEEFSALNPGAGLPRMELLEERLKDPLKNAIKMVKKRPGQVRHAMWELALSTARSHGEQISEQMLKILGMVCLSFFWTENAASKTLFVMRKRGESVNWKGISTPRLVLLEDALLKEHRRGGGGWKRGPWIYAEGLRHIQVPNIYEGVLTVYAMHYLFNIQYSSTLRPLFNFFDGLVDLKG